MNADPLEIALAAQKPIGKARFEFESQRVSVAIAPRPPGDPIDLLVADLRRIDAEGGGAKP